jgi:hypothetical protein
MMIILLDCSSSIDLCRVFWRDRVENLREIDLNRSKSLLLIKVPLIKGSHCGDATIGANPLGLGVSLSRASGVDLGGSKLTLPSYNLSILQLWGSDFNR